MIHLYEDSFENIFILTHFPLFLTCIHSLHDHYYQFRRARVICQPWFPNLCRWTKLGWSFSGSPLSRPPVVVVAVVGLIMRCVLVCVLMFFLSFFHFGVIVLPFYGFHSVHPHPSIISHRYLTPSIHTYLSPCYIAIWWFGGPAARAVGFGGPGANKTNSHPQSFFVSRCQWGWAQQATRLVQFDDIVCML